VGEVFVRSLLEMSLRGHETSDEDVRLSAVGIFLVLVSVAVFSRANISCPALY